MPDLIISYFVQSPHGNPYGNRIYEDGKVESYRVSKLVKSASGAYQDEPVTPGWYPIAKLNETQLGAARQAVEASDVRHMPEKVIGNPGNTSDPAKGELQVRSDSGVRKITVEPWFPGGETGQALFNLTRELNDLINAALA